MLARPRPTIGLTCYWRQASFGAWRLDAALVGQGYVEGVRLAGGRTLVLPPDPAWIDDPTDAIDSIDGLLSDRRRGHRSAAVGRTAAPVDGPRDPRRDAVEPALLRCAIAQGKPRLGIVLGDAAHQRRVVGTLIQHMADVTDQRPHRESDTAYGLHAIRVVPETKVSALYNPARPSIPITTKRWVNWLRVDRQRPRARRNVSRASSSTPIRSASACSGIPTPPTTRPGPRCSRGWSRRPGAWRWSRTNY